MKYTVKRLEPHTVLEQREINQGIVKSAGWRTQGYTTYGVVDESGNVVKIKNGLFEVYDRKYVAQTVADHLNSK